jgi:type IX secretion system PorP/SprF family membrane protein
MKHLLVLAAFIIVVGSAFAQQFPLRSTSMLNPFQDHAAAAGSRECLDLHMGFRSQWSGFEGAPSTGFANLHGKLLSNGPNFSSVGGRIETDEAAAWSSLSFSLAYSYNMKLSSGARFAAGLGLGAFQQKLNWSGISLPEYQVADDPAFVGNSQLVAPLLDASVWFYNRDWYGGMTIGNVAQPAVSQVAANTRLHRTFTATAGTQVELDGPWALLPSATLRAASGVPMAVDLVAFLDYNKVLGVGLGYRNQSALMAMLKVNVADYISVGYAYDWTLSTLNAASPSTHEFVIGINACDGKPHGAISCPAYN